MTIEIRDPRFLDIVDDGLELETLADGFRFTEGPIWHPREKHLIFSDIPSNRTHRWSESEGLSVHREPSERSNGNTYDRQGRMLSCEHGTSSVTREDADGSRSILASHYQGKELNSPNDIVVRENGDIFFTDPTYGRRAKGDPELDFQGVYKIDGANGALTLLRSDFEQPTGSPSPSMITSSTSPTRPACTFESSRSPTTAHSPAARSSLNRPVRVPVRPTVSRWPRPGTSSVPAPVASTSTIQMTASVSASSAPPPSAPTSPGAGDDFLTFFMTSSQHLYRTRVKVAGIPLF